MSRIRFPRAARLTLLGVALVAARSATGQTPAAVVNPVSRFASSHATLPTTTLSLAAPVTHELRGADVHRFAVSVTKGQFVAITLEQQDQDLLMVLFDPRGKLLRIIDRNTTHEREVVTFEATETGRYAVQVAQFDWMIPTATYTIALSHREPRARTLAGRADQLLGAWYDADHPGVALAVMDGPRVIYQRTIGLANVEDHRPIDAHTRFDLASLSKQFTGTAIALLAESGALRLDRPVREILPELPTVMAPVTVDHLLNHTSGVIDWDVPFSLTGREISDGITPGEVLRLQVRARALNFAPGSEQAYSNGGYALLAQVISRVTGERFETWMQRHIFDRLGMRETLANGDPLAVITQQAHSYEGRAPRVRLASANPTSITGSSSVHASLDDMVRWVRALQAGALGGAALQRRLDTPGQLTSGASTEYAYGTWIRERGGVREKSHLGLAAGFRTSIKRFGDRGLTVIMLSNDGDDATYARAEAIERLFRGIPEPAPDEQPGDDAVPESAQPRVAYRAGDFTGRFESEELATQFDLVERDGQLTARHAVLGDIALTATGPDAFRSSLPALPSLVFRRDSAGRVTGFEAPSAAYRHLAFSRRP